MTKLDRLGRSTRELLDLIDRIGKVGASFRSLGDPLWDTSSAQGRLLSTLLASIAEFERELRSPNDPIPFAICYNSQRGELEPLLRMAGYSDYYSVIARAISALPVKTDEARQAIYERARTALQERLRTIEPPISETDLAIERFALEAAIERVETASRSSDARHGLSFISTMTQIVRSVRDTLNSNIGIRADSLTTVITAGLAPGLEFIQRTRLAAHGRRIYSIFGDRQWITKYPQIRIAAGVIVAALVGIFGGIFVHWMTENNREASHSLISPSELAFSDVTLSHPDNHWEIKGVVKNDSPHTVVAFRLKITVRDCDSACVTIGEEVKRIVINIPPSQTRIIEGDLFSSETLIPKTLDWSYEIVETDAK